MVTAVLGLLYASMIASMRCRDEKAGIAVEFHADILSDILDKEHDDHRILSSHSSS
jgi:hypothetical protein